MRRINCRDVLDVRDGLKEGEIPTDTKGVQSTKTGNFGFSDLRVTFWRVGMLAGLFACSFLWLRAVFEAVWGLSPESFLVDERT